MIHNFAMGNGVPEVLRDLAPGGVIRAAINFGNPVLAQPGAGNDPPRGVSVALARELGRRLDSRVDLVAFESAAQVVAAGQQGLWDIAFLADDPERARTIGFTAPYILLEGTYLVREESPLHAIGQFDAADVHIAVGRGAAYDLFLSRHLRKARLVRAETSAQAVDLFVRDGLSAAAGVRQPLVAYAAAHPGFRVIDGTFHVITQAMATPRGRIAGLAYLDDFIAEMKSSGFVERALSRGA